MQAVAQAIQTPPAPERDEVSSGTMPACAAILFTAFPLVLLLLLCE